MIAAAHSASFCFLEIVMREIRFARNELRHCCDIPRDVFFARLRIQRHGNINIKDVPPEGCLV